MLVGHALISRDSCERPWQVRPGLEELETRVTNMFFGRLHEEGMLYEGSIGPGCVEDLYRCRRVSLSYAGTARDIRLDCSLQGRPRVW